MSKSGLTRGGVCYDLKISPFDFIVEYPDESIRYVFSSEYNRKSFNDRIEDYREEIRNSLSKRFKFEIAINKIADIKLYSNIEKRGFLIVTKEESFECLSTIRLDGNKLIIKN